jgi:hypothetical protein
VQSSSWRLVGPRGTKSPVPVLPCGAASAMVWKLRDGDGGVQARLRHDVRGASVDDEGGPEGNRSSLQCGTVRSWESVTQSDCSMARRC